MQFVLNNLFLCILLFGIVLCQETTDSLSIANDEQDKNDAWKLNLYMIGGGIVPLGQFENNKPFKALTLAGMKAYWLNQLDKSTSGEEDDISDRNRSFWWLLFLHFYGVIDAYVDSHIKEFPENIEENINKVEKE